MSSKHPTKLSLRMESLLRLSARAGECTAFWDIGCDHGLVGLNAPIFLPGLKEVNFVDPSGPVVTQLERVISAHIPKHAVKLNLIKKKGEELIVSHAEQVFLMAGIGGKTAWAILQNLREQGGPRASYVVGVNRDILLLRQHLREEGWGLIDEIVVEDQALFYQQLLLTPRGGDSVSFYGEKLWQSEVGQRYLLHQLQWLSAHRDARSRDYLSYLKGLRV